MKKFFLSLLSSESKKMIEEFIPDIKNNVIATRIEKYKETEIEATFQTVILILVVISVLINVSYTVFFKMEFQNLFSKKNFLIIIELFKSNMFIFVLKYISDKSLQKEIYNTSDEQKKIINYKIKIIIVLMILEVIIYTITYFIILKQSFKVVSLTHDNIIYSLICISFKILELVFKFGIEILFKSTNVFFITYIIYIINDIILLSVLKFIKILK